MRKTILALTLTLLAAPALAQTGTTAMTDGNNGTVQTGVQAGASANAGVDNTNDTTTHTGNHPMRHMKKSPQAMDHKAMQKTETGSKTGADVSVGLDTDKNSAGAAASGNE